ncbi:hypothetical protein PVV74_06330 [Roseovarius sp. SK2]|uniref:hypothetical protein n=1 Tax=Roseovarius TaxID=74030 RepID=UPI0011AF62FC|nr:MULTISPECIES: hypothetical protein [Roseovarius]MDD9725065.1 hypothetical protein [Roseovarius sp. SK2]
MDEEDFHANACAFFRLIAAGRNFAKFRVGKFEFSGPISCKKQVAFDFCLLRTGPCGRGALSRFGV